MLNNTLSNAVFEVLPSHFVKRRIQLLQPIPEINLEPLPMAIEDDLLKLLEDVLEPLPQLNYGDTSCDKQEPRVYDQHQTCRKQAWGVVGTTTVTPTTSPRRHCRAKGSGKSKRRRKPKRSAARRVLPAHQNA